MPECKSQAIAKRIVDKIKSKRGDTGHDAFWEYCKKDSTNIKYYTDNTEMPIPKSQKTLPKTTFEIPAECPPKPTQLPDIDFKDF